MSHISEIAQFLRSHHRYLFEPDPWDRPEVCHEVKRRWPDATEAEIALARQTAREIFEADWAFQLEFQQRSLS